MAHCARRRRVDPPAADGRGSPRRCGRWAREVVGDHAPLVIDGGGLHGIDYALPVASAQVKSAVLLAGLRRRRDRRARAGRDQAPHRGDAGAGGADVTVDGLTVRLRPSHLQPFRLACRATRRRPRSGSSPPAIVAGSELIVENVYVGPARAGFLDVLRRMGADDRGHRRLTCGSEPRGLEATEVGGDEIPGLIDEIPVLAVAAACAEGTDRVSRRRRSCAVKESDRIATTTASCGALGVACEPAADGFVVTGGSRLRGGTVDSHGDHRIAMAVAVAALAADGPTEIEGWDAVATSYPDFEQDLAAMHVIAIDGPAGSGKSTVARAVAARLGLGYLDTGAMYRAVTFAALQHGVDPRTPTS